MKSPLSMPSNSLSRAYVHVWWRDLKLLIILCISIHVIALAAAMLPIAANNTVAIHERVFTVSLLSLIVGSLLISPSISLLRSLTDHLKRRQVPFDQMATKRLITFVCGIAFITCALPILTVFFKYADTQSLKLAAVIIFLLTAIGVAISAMWGWLYWNRLSALASMAVPGFVMMSLGMPTIEYLLSSTGASMKPSFGLIIMLFLIIFMDRWEYLKFKHRTRPSGVFATKQNSRLRLSSWMGDTRVGRWILLTVSPEWLLLNAVTTVLCSGVLTAGSSWNFTSALLLASAIQTGVSPKGAGGALPSSRIFSLPYGLNRKNIVWQLLAIRITQAVAVLCLTLLAFFAIGIFLTEPMLANQDWQVLAVLLLATLILGNCFSLWMTAVSDNRFCSVVTLFLMIFLVSIVQALLSIGMFQRSAVAIDSFNNSMIVLITAVSIGGLFLLRTKLLYERIDLSRFHR
jgi:hypothetical protein